MRSHTVRSGYPVRGQRRKLVWATQNEGFPAVAAGANKVIDLLTAFKAKGNVSVLGSTVMRVHGTVRVAVSGGQEPWNMGILVGRTGDPAANRPDPTLTADEDLDWMFTQKHFPTFSGGTVDGAMQWEVDIRSKRKLQELDQTLLLCLHSGAVGSVTPLIFFRTLLALP